MDGNHFFKIMLGDFRTELRIPRQFSLQFKAKTGDRIVLRGPRGNATTVELMQEGEDYFFVGGWRDFIEYHGIKVTDFLVFRLNDDFSVNVILIFDNSGCERKASYFTDNKSSCSKKKHVEQQIDSDDATERDDVREVARTEGTDDDALQQPQKDHATTSKSNRDKDVQGTMKTPHVEKANYPLYFRSNRRRVTDEEKQSTYQIASRHLKGPSFLVRMQPSHVRHGFTLTIPKLWANSNLPSNLQEIQLGIWTSEELWAVKYRRSTQNMLLTGWSKFVFDNNIEEDDVCVFELRRVSQGKPVIFDVHIFRVVNEVVPLSEYRPAKNSRNG
ncbi:hypothetical protein Droror1_Dr00009098 [Drosera rotundifolia]